MTRDEQIDDLNVRWTHNGTGGTVRLDLRFYLGERLDVVDGTNGDCHRPMPGHDRENFLDYMGRVWDRMTEVRDEERD